MRIDELDSDHKKFKEIILDHNITEQELVEVGFLAPIAANVGRFALQRALPAIGRGAMRGARAVGRGVKGLGKGIGRGIGYGLGSGGGDGGQSMASRIAGAITQAGDAARDLGTDLSARNTGKVVRKNNNKSGQQSMKTDTAAKLSQQGGGPSQTIGTQPTVGTQGTQGTQGTDQLQRGSEVKVPVTNPGDPNKTIPADMKVKNVTGSEIELEPAKRGKGFPKTVKYDKKDLQLL